MTIDANDWRVWQWVDSAFPAGSFAHSAGLEAAWQAGEIDSAASLHHFLRAGLLQSLSAAAPFVAAAYDDPGRVWEIDARCDAFLSSVVANRASRRQGQAILASSLSILGSPGLAELRAQAFETSRAVHLPPLFGAIARLSGLPRDVTLSTFLFASVRTVISAAVRLGIVGPMQAQAMQRSFAQEAASLAAMVPPLPHSEAAQTAPLLDLYQGLHDRLYSKLFQS